MANIMNFDDLIPMNVMKFPVCYFKNSKCIDNTCGSKCCNNYHGLLDYVNHYISRGIDDKGRFFLLFFYKDNETKRIYYEFIYTLDIYKNTFNDTKFFTYSGFNNKCFIGNLSYNNNQNPEVNQYFKRIIGNNSFNYMQRLLNFRQCGPVEYDNETNTYLEYEYVYSDDEEENESKKNQLNVCLYFNKKEIQRNINYNKFNFS